MGLKNPETVPYSILSKIYKLFLSDGKDIGKGNYKHIVQIMGEEVRDRLMDNLGRFFLSSQDVDSPGVKMKVLIVSFILGQMGILIMFFLYGKNVREY